MQGNKYDKYKTENEHMESQIPKSKGAFEENSITSEEALEDLKNE